MGLIETWLSQKPNNPIFHYTSQTGLLGIVRANDIWGTNIHYLNDKSEFAHAISEAKSVIAGRKNDASNRQLFDLITSKLNSIRKLNIFVTSFSEEFDLLSQWRGYCPQGGGYSVGFEYKILRPIFAEKRYMFVKCLYDPVEQQEVINELLDVVINRYKEIKSYESDAEEKASEKFIRKFIGLAAAMKSWTFSEEKEWRLISQYKRIDDPAVQYREDKSMLIPYLPFPLTSKGESLRIKRVVIGPTPHEELSLNSTRYFLLSMNVDFGAVQFSQIPYRDW